MNTGNDDLLFGQPNNLEEAVDTLIAFCGEDRLQAMMKGGCSRYDSKPVFRLSEFIRNTWFLWWYPDHNNAWFPATKPPLLAFFNYVGITHPDDMTDIILSAVMHWLHNKPYDLFETVQALQAYWKEQGYPDGKPDTNSF